MLYVFGILLQPVDPGQSAGFAETKLVINSARKIWLVTLNISHFYS